jgi:hypothetical protein
MNKFWDLFAQSVIVQSVLALVMVGVICYLAVTGQEIPEVLVNAVMLILGFYFGSKSAYHSGYLAGSRRKEG